MNVILQFLKIKEINTDANRLLINILFLSYKILIHLILFKMEKKKLNFGKKKIHAILNYCNL